MTQTTVSEPKVSSSVSRPAAEDMTFDTNYDFVPGDKVIFFDDLSGDEEAEFPMRWKLKEGVFEIAYFGDEKWILCTDAGTII